MGTRDPKRLLAERSRRLNFVYQRPLRGRDQHMAEESPGPSYHSCEKKGGKIPIKPLLAGWMFKTRALPPSLKRAPPAFWKRREQRHTLQTELQSAAPDLRSGNKCHRYRFEALDLARRKRRQALLLRFLKTSFGGSGKRLGSAKINARKRVTPRAGKAAPLFKTNAA